jgi:protocatechuate 3,4-dioxygenase alpha subunit
VKPVKFIPTGEATIGPFFPPRYVDAGANDLTMLEGRKAKGEIIEIRGRVTQLGGQPLENLIVEIWQADAQGIYRHPADPRHARADPNFLGWGRAATDKNGGYLFRTIRPGTPAGRQPHVNFMVMFSGLMRMLRTTMFFDEGSDPVLDLVESRKNLLIGKKTGPGQYQFDIQLRGENETPFFGD